MTTALHAEALALYERGELDNARIAVERFLQHDAIDHVQFANGLLLLSCVHCSMGHFVEAERMVATCHGYLVEHLGANHSGASSALLNRAVILLERYYHRTSLQRAIAHQQHQSHSPASLLEEDSEDNAEPPQGAITWVVAAKEYLDAAAAALENAYGLERLVLADVHHNLGCCCEILGGYADAVGHYMRSLKIREKYKDANGTTDLKLALTMEHVAMIYRLTEAKMNDAMRILAVVAATRRKFLGPYHPLYTAALFEQGVCAYEALNRRHAHHLLRKVLEIREKTLGPQHPDTRLTRCYLEAIRRQHAPQGGTSDVGRRELEQHLSNPAPFPASDLYDGGAPTRSRPHPRMHGANPPSQQTSVELDVRPVSQSEWCHAEMPPLHPASRLANVSNRSLYSHRQ